MKTFEELENLLDEITPEKFDESVHIAYVTACALLLIVEQLDYKADEPDFDGADFTTKAGAVFRIPSKLTAAERAALVRILGGTTQVAETPAPAPAADVFSIPAAGGSGDSVDGFYVGQRVTRSPFGPGVILHFGVDPLAGPFAAVQYDPPAGAKPGSGAIQQEFLKFIQPLGVAAAESGPVLRDDDPASDDDIEVSFPIGGKASSNDFPDDFNDDEGF